MLESLGFSAMFGGLGILLAAAGVLIFDFVDYRIDHAEEIRKGNMAAAVVNSAFILGICYILGRAVGG